MLRQVYQIELSQTNLTFSETEIVQFRMSDQSSDQHQMDPSITEWILKTGETKLSYTVDIPDCEEVIRKYQNGQFIETKEFKILNSKFKLIVEPNLACDEEEDNKENNFVAIYLENLNNWGVKFKVKFNVKNKKQTVGPSLLGSRSKDGSQNFIPHARIRIKPPKNNVLTSDGALKLRADIELLGEEVNSFRENAINNNSELNNLIYSQFIFVKEEIEAVKTRCEVLKTQIETSSKFIDNQIGMPSGLKRQAEDGDHNANQVKRQTIEEGWVSVLPGRMD